MTDLSAEAAAVAKRAEQMLPRLTPAMKRNLLALPTKLDVWMTIAEMRGSGATGSGMDILFVYWAPKVCQRRWARWGGEAGQKSGEGYEYAISPLGLAVRALLMSQPDEA